MPVCLIFIFLWTSKDYCQNSVYLMLNCSFNWNFSWANVKSNIFLRIRWVTPCTCKPLGKFIFVDCLPKIYKGHLQLFVRITSSFLTRDWLSCISRLFIKILPILVGNCSLSFESLYFYCSSSFYWSCLHSRIPQLISINSIWSKLRRARYFLFFFDSKLFYILHCCQLKETGVWGSSMHTKTLQPKLKFSILNWEFYL